MVGIGTARTMAIDANISIVCPQATDLRKMLVSYNFCSRILTFRPKLMRRETNYSLKIDQVTLYLLRSSCHFRDFHEVEIRQKNQKRS